MRIQTFNVLPYIADDEQSKDDCAVLHEYIGHVVGMCQFRHYLKDTAGEKVIQFWLDMERLSRMPRDMPQERWLALREIQIKYFKMDSIPGLQSTSQWEIMSGIHRRNMHEPIVS